MKAFFEKLWGALTAYPDSYDDYVGVGRWLVYKKLLAILAVLLPLLIAGLCLWLQRPEKPFEIPVFFYLADKLKVFSGEAILVDEDGAVVYRGRISGGLCAGRGRQLAPPDETPVYEGDFLGNVYNGQGKLYGDGALLYEGGFLDGRYSGAGILYEGGAPLYEGQFAQGMYNGRGVLYQGEKPLYDGEFLDGLYDGDGVLYDKDGAVVYTGGFARGCFEGAGLQTTPEGVTVYEGSFRNGLYDGAGSLYTGGGVRLEFQGVFVKGKPSRSGGIYNERGQLLYEGNVLDGKADYVSLLGLPLSELQKQVRELPVIYYGSGYTGFLYRELGFAVVTRYDYTAFRALDAEALYEGAAAETPAEPPETDAERDGPELFSKSADNLVANTLLVSGALLYGQLPEQGARTEKPEITGFEALMEARLAAAENPGYQSGFTADTVRRGDHLYETVDLPETVKYGGTGIFTDPIYYYYRSEMSAKGAVPEVILCKKAEYGG